MGYARGMAGKAPDADTLWPIRGVAERTGITPATLRIWERRYGRPVPVRIESGHRRYTDAQMRWLVRVSEALANGHRASDVLQAEPGRLDELLDREPIAERTDDALMQAVRAFDGAALTRSFERAASKLTPVRFLDAVVAPFLQAVGAAWADGRLEIAHEHFASNVVSDVLARRRARGVSAAAGEPVVLATLNGEAHVLGIAMAEFLCAHARVPTRYLGADTPEDEVVRAALECGARAVVVGVSAANAGVEADRRIASLRRALPAGTELVVGGRRHKGRRRRLAGVRDADDFEDLDKWLAERAEEERA